MDLHCHYNKAFRCARALAWCLILGSLPVHAIALSDRARESGCTTKPVQNSDGLYKCKTQSGAEAYFNVPDGRAPAPTDTGKPGTGNTAAPPNFPRVDAGTQKSRDDMRKKVLTDELATEEKQLADARAEFSNGSPAPLPEEKADAEKYRQRIERLRQTVQLHERNVDALKKEMAR